MKLLRSRRTQTVTDVRGPTQGVTAHLRRDVHDAFDRMAKARGVSKGTLNRLLIEGIVAQPEICDEIIKAGSVPRARS